MKGGIPVGDTDNVFIGTQWFVDGLDPEEREALGWTTDDLLTRWENAVPAKVKRSAPWSWRLKRAGRALRGRH